MSFYNPYMQRPDYGQGIQDFIQQMFQMMMYKKMMESMGRGGQETAGPETPPMPDYTGGTGGPPTGPTMVDPATGQINPGAFTMSGRSPEDQSALLRYWWSQMGGLKPPPPQGSFGSLGFNLAKRYPED